ncbi:uncharacterized protein LOC123514983 [Portunus trituberculatus]|uniref:uncharacterized protein LOC123514983 n=1 Tax=Portunus trituberculatus TaxID=210409 RepID=UPI001E1CF797|nr:uncharacterized protein LOC123514983 [Portunus trituberculatus]
MSAPSGGRRRFLGLLLVFLLGFVTLVEAVPATDERSHRLPRWIDGLWKKIRSGYDSVSSSSDYTDQVVMDALNSASKTVTEGVDEMITMQRDRRRSPSYDEDYIVSAPAPAPAQPGTTSSGESVYRFLGLDEDVMHHFKTFLSPANPASMMVFEHRSIIFWMVTQVFTDADGALMSGQAGHLYIYAVWGNQMQSTIVETNGAVKCEVFLKAIDFVDFVCAERLYQHQHFESTKNGSGVYRMTWHDKLEVTLRRPLPTHSVRDLLVWRYEDHALIAFLNTLEVRTLYGGLQVDGLTQVASDIFRHRSMMVEGRLFTSYNHLEKAAFITKHARGFAKLVIGSRHFLAVANFMGKDGNTETHSDIFVYESGVGTRLFQRVRTSAARSFASFTFRSAHKEEHFLVVANEYSVNAAGMKNYHTESMIYKFYRNKFMAFQCIQTVAARQWVVYQGPRGEFLLGVVSGQSGVVFYQYNGWRFVQMSFQIKQAGIRKAWIGYLGRVNQAVLTLTHRSSSRPLVYYLRFQHFRPRMQEDAELQWCSLFQLGKNPRSVLARVQRAPRRDQPFTFPRPIRITGNLLLAQSNAVSTIGVIHVRQDGYKVDHSFSKSVANLDEVQAAFARLARARAMVARSVKLDGPNLNGFHFHNATFIPFSHGMGDFIVNKLRTSMINGQPFSVDKLIWLQRDQQLHRLTLEHADLGAGVSASVTYLSGPDLARTNMQDLVTLSGNHSISGHKDFGVVKVNSLVVSGRISNIRFDANTLLLTDKEQTITSEYTMQALGARTARLQLLNGRDITTFLQQLVLNNTNTAITGHVIVRGDVIANSIQTTGSVQPLDPQDIARRALLHSTQNTQIVTGIHTVGGVSMEGGLRVVGTLNGLSIPRDVYLRSSNETVNRPVTFNSLQASSVQVLSRLGDVRVLNGELDVLLVHGDQQVSGRKVFTEMVLLGHSSVSLTVSGHRLRDLEKNTLIQDLLVALQSGRSIMGEVRFEGRVDVVDAVLGGANVTHMFLFGLPLHTTSIPATFVFEGPVRIVGDTRVTNHLNGKRVDLYALLAGTHTFTRQVTFTSDLVAEGHVHVATTVNGINLQELHRVLALLSSTVTVTNLHDITLHSPSFRGGLEVRRGGSVVVAGLDLQDVVMRDTDAIITGLKTMPAVQVATAAAGHVEVLPGGRVDGVVLEDLFFANSLRKTAQGTQQIVGGSLGVVVAASVTGTQLGAFERSVVYRDTASERLGGSLRFNGQVTIQDLSFSMWDLRWVSAEEYKSAWLLRTGDQVLTGLNTIETLDVLDLTFNGRILQGVDFERLVKNTAKVDEVTLLHQVTFGQLLSNGQVVVNGTVQGIKLSQEAVTTSASAITITGSKVFQDKVHYREEFSIEQQAIVTSGGNDQTALAVDIEELCAAILSVPAASTRIRRWIIQGDARFEQQVRVLDSFNGEAVATLDSTFWLTHIPTRISAVAFLAHVEAQGSFNVDVAGKTNGQSLEEVWNQLLKRTCEAQTVSGQLTVHTLTVDHLSTPALTNPNDDLRVADLLNILLVDGDQVITGMLNFTSVEAQHVVLEGTINGLQVNSDFVVQGRQAVISGRKTFAHLTILGNLSMVEGGTVQGVDVSELSRLAARKTGQGQVIVVPGLTTLQSLNYVGSNFLVEGRVDGVVLRRDTVLLRTVEQVMSGTLEVTAGDARLPAVVAPLLVVLDNRFNGVEFDRLQNMTVRMDRRVVIQNNVVFQGMCRFTSLAIRSQLVNGVHLRELAELINADYLLNLGNHLGAVLHAARSTREVMAVKGAEIWYYEELPFQKLSKLIAVTLRSDTLVFGVHDSLVGIDMTNDAVYTYRMDVPFPALYPAVKVLEPIAVAGLGSGLLATCGRLAMDATPAGTHQLPNFQVIHLQGGTGTGYGHIYSLEANGGVLAAFETRECRDLVSFQLQDGRVCVAVLNYRAPTIILCGTASTGFHLLTRLDTTRATKGVWVSFQGAEYLLVGQEPSQTEAGVLALYKYDHSLSRMVLVSEAHEPVSSHVVATVLGDAILVAVTGKRTPLCDTFVEVYLTNTTDIGHNLQRLEVPEAVHSSLLHLHTGEVVLMVQTRHSLYHYYLRGTKFVFVREMNTASSLCPWSTPFLAGDPRTLHIAYAGLGAYQEDYKGAKLLPVSTTIYRAVYRGPSFDTLYRGSSHLSSSLHAHPPSTSYSISYGSTPHYRS